MGYLSGKKCQRRAVLMSMGDDASGNDGKQSGWRPAASRRVVQTSWGPTLARKFFQYSFLVFLMALKYTRRRARDSESRGGVCSLQYALCASRKSWRSLDNNPVHQGLECKEGRFRGVCRDSRDVITDRYHSNHAEREVLVGRGGGLVF